MRSLFTLLLAVTSIAGCADVPTESDAPVVLVHLAPAGGDDALLARVFEEGLDTTLAPDLGWIEWHRSTRADYSDGSSALLVPVEAEDELRRLCFRFEGDRLVQAVALGYAETSWFWADRAETLSTFEGWVYAYDLTTGCRVVARYFPGGSADEQPFVVVERGTDPCLAVLAANPPAEVRPTIFLAREQLAIDAQFARELLTLPQCLAGA